MTCDLNAGSSPTFSDDMLPVVWILRLLTIAPISYQKGRFHFSWRSWPMAWAITSFILMSVYAVYVIRIKYSDMLNESRTFSDVMFFWTFLQLLHHHFVSPLIHWPEAHGFAEYLECWKEFQMEFEKVTRTPLGLGLRRQGWLHFTLSFAVPALLCVVLTSYLKPLGYYELLPFISTGMFHSVMPATWNMFGLAVVRAAGSLQENLDAVLAQGKEDSEVTRILKEFRRLWTKLSKLSAAPGNFWGVTSIHFILYCLVTLLMSAFGFMTALQQGSLSNRGKALACLVVDNLAHALTLCSAGYSSSDKVNSMRRRLLEIKFKSTGVALKQEIVSVVVTYLCVLAQFGAAVNQLYSQA